MEREIIFRAKTLNQHNIDGNILNAGEWIYGAYFNMCHNDHRTHIHHFIIPNGADVSIGTPIEKIQIEVDPETIGQFTGLKDINGKGIFEGDIIVVNGLYPRIVLWDKICWALMPTKHYHDKTYWIMNIQHPDADWWEDYAKEIEVIGNIYDNPINKK